jgi:hypothetical protein
MPRGREIADLQQVAGEFVYTGLIREAATGVSSDAVTAPLTAALFPE